MDFGLTEEQKQIKQMVREFAESEIKPQLMEWDEAQHFPTDVFRKAGELGMLGVTIPDEYGGANLSYVDYVNVIEELGVVDSMLVTGSKAKAFRVSGRLACCSVAPPRYKVLFHHAGEFHAPGLAPGMDWMTWSLAELNLPILSRSMT